MKVLINGEPRVVDVGTTVAGLLGILGLNVQATVVERNRAIIDRERYGATALEEGDTLELIQLVGGG